MKMSSKAGSRVFFAFSTNNGVYSETWKATVGKPWKHFGFTGETWPTKECGKKRGGCGRTFEGDEALWPVKERVDWPSDPTNRPSEDNPRYIIVSYMAEGAGTCATVSDRSEDSSASSGHMANLKVTPQPHDSFHAVRIEPGLRRGSTVFDTSRQLHYDLVGYARYNDSKGKHTFQPWANGSRSAGLDPGFETLADTLPRARAGSPCKGPERSATQPYWRFHAKIARF